MIIEQLSRKDRWEEFLRYKISGGHLTAREQEALCSFIENEEYMAAVERISDGGFFSIPTLSFVNKGFSEKKRTVFTFPEDENLVQKMITYLLGEYDFLFADNLYSFRRNTGVKKAITRLKAEKDIGEMYSFKLDVSDYFNSVSPHILLPMAQRALPSEGRLLACLSEMLQNPFAVKNGEQIQIKKGIMAGTPIASFFANLYLCELDALFCKKGVLYARYSDDIIVFAKTLEELCEHKKTIYDFLEQRELGVNEKKVAQTVPGEEWSFLGFRFINGEVDISRVALQKLKKKMKRKANALVRWKNKKQASPERAVRAFIRYFNKKFFCNSVNSEITWCRWFFPIIDSSRGLKETDAYMQECIRYIATEKRSKARFDFRYEDMKKLGYVSLVSCFYQFKKTGTYSQMESKSVSPEKSEEKEDTQ